ncbi:MAG: hypothetical protein HYY17_15270 [Planctomycetes bacterium]|nr:hypothetical protein [Planctomycetota bacterium]
MELKSITERVDHVPFIPFRLEFDNGRNVTVRHPEDIFFIPNRMKLHEIIAYDREKEESIAFHPCAVTALAFAGNGGSAGP